MNKNDNFARVLKYKGIAFDMFAENIIDNKTIYSSNICPACAEKYKHLLTKNEIDFDDYTVDCCAVCGCGFTCESDDDYTYLIDFKSEHVVIAEIDKLYLDRTVQKVLQAAYDKLYYDFRHESIEDRLDDGIFFNSEEQPCGKLNGCDASDRGLGIDVSIYIEKNADQYSPFKYTVKICYDNENDESQLIFQEDFLPEHNFGDVVDALRPFVNVETQEQLGHEEQQNMKLANLKIAKHLEEKFENHIGHKITITQYKNGDLVLECLDCQEALLTVSDFKDTGD